MKFDVMGEKGKPVVVMLTGSFVRVNVWNISILECRITMLLFLHITATMKMRKILRRERMKRKRFGSISRIWELNVFI